jgi:hypothetical protein
MAMGDDEFNPVRIGPDNPDTQGWATSILIPAREISFRTATLI